MTTPFFPNVEQLLDIVLAELPDGVYATDRADNTNKTKRSVSSSELRSHAQIFANLYENLSNVYADKFISTVTSDGIPKWEKELFEDPQDPLLTFAQRQQNLLAQLRAFGGISYPVIFDLVDQILTPLGLSFALIPWNGCGGGPAGAWILDFTPLDVGTYLASRDPLIGARRDLTPLDCDLDYAAAGLTAQDLADIQETAYTYEVLIFGVADAATLVKLDKRLTRKEPARSTHKITNNAPALDWIDPNILDLGPFLGDSLRDRIDCGRFDSPPATYDVFDFGGF